MRLLVCGGRYFTDEIWLYRELDTIHREQRVDFLIAGDALGADQLATQWALANKIANRMYFAQWERLGRGAGPERNKRMLVDGKPDLVVAFPGGAGTENMVRQAKAAHVRVGQYFGRRGSPRFYEPEDWRDHGP